MAMSTCTFPGCEKRMHCKGLCVSHDSQVRQGKPLTAIRPADPIARFWTHVDKGTDCWEWTASRTRLGYGAYGWRGRVQPAHRVAWEITYGPIADGIELDHTCHNRGCVNPNHLREATHALNAQNLPARSRSNTSGFRGVSRAGKGWVARVMRDGISYHGGIFATAEEAGRKAAEMRARLLPYSLN